MSVPARGFGGYRGMDRGGLRGGGGGRGGGVGVGGGRGQGALPPPGGRGGVVPHSAPEEKNEFLREEGEGGGQGFGEGGGVEEAALSQSVAANARGRGVMRGRGVVRGGGFNIAGPGGSGPRQWPSVRPEEFDEEAMRESRTIKKHTIQRFARQEGAQYCVLAQMVRASR
jgi:hypothetical protein